MMARITLELRKCAKKTLLNIYNAMNGAVYFHTTRYFHTRIIMIPNPGKNLTQATSYKPISLMSVLSKIYEKLHFNQIKSPQHHFEFRNSHSTVEQVHRIVTFMKHSIKKKLYSSSLFIDKAQAFDKVRHGGLLFKISHNSTTEYT